MSLRLSPIRPGVDERLILPCVGSGGYSGRLAVRFEPEGKGLYVGQPCLDRVRTPLAHLGARGLSVSVGGHYRSPTKLYVTYRDPPGSLLHMRDLLGRERPWNGWPD